MPAFLSLLIAAMLCAAPRAAADDAGNGFRVLLYEFSRRDRIPCEPADVFHGGFAFNNGSAFGEVYAQCVAKKYSLRSAGLVGPFESQVKADPMAKLLIFSEPNSRCNEYRRHASNKKA